MSADGKIACASGDSKWITGETARKQVHMLRKRYSGILAGIGTVLADDPLLTCRLPGGRSPVRIILDSDLRIPLESRLVQTAKETPLIVIRGKEDLPASQETGGTPADPDKEEIRADRQTLLEEAGVTVLTVGKDEYGRVVFNERGTYEYSGIWYYELNIYNFVNADYSKYSPKLFFRKEPDYEFEDMRKLRYNG